jgi:EPS-associated MarR family transcriptional regulator
LLHDEITLNILKHIETTQNQRSLASELKISVGKVNYVLKALIDKGLIKAENFYQNKKKNQYQYLLTPKGFQEKVTLTENFIERKKLEYDMLVFDLEQYKNNGVNI